MNKMSAWAIKNPVLPLVMFAVLLFVGVISFIRLPINNNPDVSFPLISIIVTQPGAAPTEIETQVTQKVEAAVANLTGVKDIISRMVEGQSLTNVQFEIGTDVFQAMNDARDAISKIRGELPEGINEPLIQRQEFDGGAIAYFAISTTSMTEEQLSWFVDNTISKRLNNLPGVAQASRGGGVEREIRVELDPTRMQSFGITAVEVNQQIRQMNLDAPGGRAQIAGGEQAIRVLGGARTALELADRQVRLPGGRVVRLGDIAEVRDGIAELRSMSRLDGRPATTLAIMRSIGSSEVTVMDLVDKELDKIRAESPQIAIKKVFTTVEMTKKSYRSALIAMIEGAILAVAVVYFFLRDKRATMISALAIPLSAIPTFFFMQWMGFTLNGITLLGLSLVAGVLVDDAIVEIENIVRHMRMGKSGYQAAMDAADEIGLAVVATSATIIVVFLPVSFMGGFTGQYFKQFGLTVAAAVLFSLLVARLITPVLAAYMLKPHENIRDADGPLMNKYLEWLQLSLRHRWLTLFGAVAFFAVSIGLLVVIPKDVIPAGDFSSSQVSVELPPGVRLEDTARVSGQIVDMLLKQPEVSAIVESIGDNDEVRQSTIFITLVPPEDRKLSQDQWEKKMAPSLRTVADAQVSFGGFTPGGGKPIALYIVGEDPVRVENSAHEVVAAMKAIPELDDPRVNGDYQRPEIVVKPNLDLAAELGVSVASISQTIRIATMGDLPQSAPKFSLSDRQIPIRVSLREFTRQDIDTLQSLPVPTANGGNVPLKAVAEISFGQGPATIRRYNQSRRMYIESGLKAGAVSGDANAKVKNLEVLKNLPQGVRLVETGLSEIATDMMTAFGFAIGAGVLMVFAVMVLLFARLFQPITIMSALPLSVGGAMVALMVFQMPFSMPVAIGILMLMGIVGKNSILLVDFAIEEMRAGKDRRTALLESGHKRARPIVMTTVAMVAGMLPIAIGLGGDVSFNRPMAITVIGGLITSTALTLVVVPAVFTIIDDVERWLAPKFSRALASAETPAAAAADIAR